jgi:hypothetical protein
MAASSTPRLSGATLGSAQARTIVSILPFVRKEIVYEVIAKRIIDAAGNGERDPIQLRKTGLTALGLDDEDKWTR